MEALTKSGYDYKLKYDHDAKKTLNRKPNRRIRKKEHNNAALDYQEALTKSDYDYKLNLAAHICLGGGEAGSNNIVCGRSNFFSFYFNLFKEIFFAVQKKYFLRGSKKVLD